MIGSFDSSRALFTFSRVRSEEPAVVSSTRGGVRQDAPLSTRILRAAVRPAVLVANGVVPAVPAARLNLVCSSAVRSASDFVHGGPHGLRNPVGAGCSGSRGWSSRRAVPRRSNWNGKARPW